MKPIAFTCVLGVVALWSIAAAQTEPRISGHWEGGISLPDSSQLQISVDLYQDAQRAWRGDIDIPAQGAQDVPLKDIVVAGRAVSFEISIGQGNPKFQGQLSEDGTTITGDFVQAGNKLAFSIKRAGDAKVRAVAKNPPLPEKFVGTWEGALETPNGNLRVVFHLANSDGAASGSIDSLDQGANGIPMSEITTADNAIKIVVAAVSGSYEAKLSEDGKALTGTWSQGGVPLPLVLNKK